MTAFAMEGEVCGIRVRRSWTDHAAIRGSLGQTFADGMTDHRVMAEERTN
ncbi:MAG: hypothetical protein OSA40_07310 [Phycisphaerales bacterium]|nr:hypothetical protein [Phycisphaerales bacterium]